MAALQTTEAMSRPSPTRPSSPQGSACLTVNPLAAEPVGVLPMGVDHDLQLSDPGGSGRGGGHVRAGLLAGARGLPEDGVATTCLVKTIWERFSRPLSRTRSMAVPRRTQDRRPVRRCRGRRAVQLTPQDCRDDHARPRPSSPGSGTAADYASSSELFPVAASRRADRSAGGHSRQDRAACAR